MKSTPGKLMKTHSWISLSPFTPFACAVALFAAPLHPAYAQDPWETTYTAANPDSHRRIANLATDTAGTVVGSQLSSGNQYTSLVSSSDGGTTWIESPSVAGAYL
jgi:hypothetical protein